MRRLNTQALATLPNAKRQSGGVEAVLLEYDISGNAPKPLWLFLVNPQVLRFQRNAKYAEISPLASKQSELQYTGSEGLSLSIQNLILMTWYEGKSLRPLLEGVNKLLEADINNKKYSPPILKFQMGAREFGPCVLTSVQWDEAAWLGGEPATVQLSLELKEVPKAVSRGKVEASTNKQVEEAKQTREKQGKPRLKLTERQRADASNAAKKYLEKNVNVWSADIQAAIKGNKYKLSTDADSGVVTMIGVGGAKLGVVLVNLGSEIKAGAGVTTIATMKGAKPPSSYK
jgi:biotin carboxyl carrier protein